MQMVAPTLVALLALASLALALIDFRRGIIPDWLNLVVALTGLARALVLDERDAVFAAAGAGLIIGGGVLALRQLYFCLRGYHGLGLGDVKLLAASAIWIGMAGIPVQLMVASVTALIAAVAMHVTGCTLTRQTALPFGPFLALGLLATLAMQQQGWMA